MKVQTSFIILIICVAVQAIVGHASTASSGPLGYRCNGVLNYLQVLFKRTETALQQSANEAIDMAIEETTAHLDLVFSLGRDALVPITYRDIIRIVETVNGRFISQTSTFIAKWI